MDKIDVPEFEGIDPGRLVCAAHELAHLMAFRSAGIEVTEIHVYGRGDSAGGYVYVPKQDLNDQMQRGYLVATLAGREGDIRFCNQVGLKRYSDHRSCRLDIAEFRKDKREWRLKVPDSVLRTEARRLVSGHWSKILRLAPKLARRGQIAL
jgi:hypothetical protein